MGKSGVGRAKGEGRGTFRVEKPGFHIIHLETIPYINCTDSSNTDITSR